MVKNKARIMLKNRIIRVKMCVRERERKKLNVKLKPHEESERGRRRNKDKLNIKSKKHVKPNCQQTYYNLNSRNLATIPLT